MNRKIMAGTLIACAVLIFLAYMNLAPFEQHSSGYKSAAHVGESRGGELVPVMDSPRQIASAPPDVQRPSTAAVADQVYMKFRACVMAQRAATLFQRQLGVCDESRRSLSFDENSEWAAQCKRKEEQYAPQIDASRTVLSDCGKPDDIEEAYFLATEAAATQGNLDAQLCYAADYFDRTGAWTPEERLLHQSRSPQYLRAALERGDWRWATLLWQTHLSNRERSALTAGVLGEPSVPSELKLNRLFRLGTTDTKFKKMLDVLPNGVGSPPPTPSEIREADAWAERIYSLHFAQSEKISARPEVCPRTFKEVF